MPKSQFINPINLRKPGYIEFEKIPVNQYNKTLTEERLRYVPADLIRIYHDMVVIRKFEEMLNAIKVSNEYKGVNYNHPGPAHLAIGQEAAAVGMAYMLDEEDYIFGSHRSHGEIIAKGLSAINKMKDASLMGIMKNFQEGNVYRIIKKGLGGAPVKDIAKRFLLYGTMAEIFARSTGFNSGLGGSMHAFFTPFGVYPNNAIVGGSGDIAVGAALYKKINNKRGIVVCNIGDASMACGPVWEGLVFSTMDQYKKLWEGIRRGGLPLIINIVNNQYGMGGQTVGETMGCGITARIAAGLNPEMMNAERIDGYNPLAVIDAYSRKRELIADKKGPALLDVLTYRYSGHSPSDASSYRTPEELEAWKQHDSILSFGKELVKGNIVTLKTLSDIHVAVENQITEILKLAIDDRLSPTLNLDVDPEAIAKLMFSNNSQDSMESRRSPETLMKLEDNPRVKQIKNKSRFYLDKSGKPISKMKTYQFKDGLFEAIIDRFYKDPTFIAYGEENRDWGGAFGVYRGLTEALPYHRLFNAPIAEGAIVGTAIGYAMCGGRALVEIMYCDFLGRCGDQVFNQLPKWQAMSGNTLKMPVVVRVSVGSKYGAQHSQDWSSLVAHIPGLKVCFPATPYDAKGLMNSALQGTDPVIFFESQRIYDIGEQFQKGGVPEDYYEIPFGEPDVKRKGSDITILTVGATLYTALEAADILKKKHDIEAEVIDARCLVPFNYEPVVKSVLKTGRILIASDASIRGSFINDMAHNITQLTFDELDAPPVVVGARNWIVPAYELENYFFPQKEWIIDAIHEKIMPLKKHKPITTWSDVEILRRNYMGI